MQISHRQHGISDRRSDVSRFDDDGDDDDGDDVDDREFQQKRSVLGHRNLGAGKGQRFVRGGTSFSKSTRFESNRAARIAGIRAEEEDV